ncbi:MAG: serine/threonine-protein kinase [Planctomycetota bacterium]
MVPERLGSYRILSDLGKGGMGSVYLAEVEGQVHGLKKGDRVAMKIVHGHLFSKPGFFKRFLREAEFGKKVRHDNVVRTYDVDALLQADEHVNFLVMEYVEGQTLRSLLNELGPIPEELCRHIGREVAKGLAAIHEAGVVHRDLKPENILVTPDHVVKIMDLGMARLADEAIRLSQSGAFAGSILYAAPEQFAGGDADPRSDLYALGLVLYELCTGRHPFEGLEVGTVIQQKILDKIRPAAEINPRISAFLEEVLATLLQRSVNDRVASAAELATLFDEGEQSVWWQERARRIREQTKGPLRRIRLPKETAFFGRARELETLRGLYGRAREGAGRVVLIEGEAGMGKTRLLDEFVERLRDEGEDFQFLFGTYPPGGAATASGGFSTAYREHFGEQGLEKTLETYVTVAPALIPALTALLKGTPVPKGEVQLTRESLHTVFVHVTRALARERPTVVAIEDLHFAPEEGRNLFEALALALPGHRILLVGTVRHGVAEAWLEEMERLPNASRLPLSQLAPKDLEGLLIDSFRSQRLAEKLGWQIALKSDCNPFFALEIVRGLREGEFITQEADGAWAQSQVIDEIRIPSSVQDLIEARLAKLSEEDKDLLDVAACCGFEFDPVLVGEALRVERTPVLKHFARIERRHRLVRSAGRRFVFDHHPIQETLYASLPQLLREGYHAALARVLQKRKESSAADGALSVEICDHFLKAGEGPDALRYLKEALNHLSEGHLNAAVADLAGRALAEEGLLEGQERVLLLLRRAWRLSLLGRREQERAALDEALSLVDQADDTALQARTRWNAGLFHLHISQYDAARGHFERALEIARRAGNRDWEVRSIGALGVVQSRLGRHEEALEHHERALALAREEGDKDGEAMAIGNLGHVFWSRGIYREALQHFERDHALSLEFGGARTRAQTTENLAVIYRALGRLEEARGTQGRAIALFREVGDRRGEAIARGNLANVFADMGSAEESRAETERSMALSKEIEYRGGVISALLSLGARCEEDGQCEQACAHFREARAAAEQIDSAEDAVVASAHLALLGDEEVSRVVEAYRENEARLGPRQKLEIGYLLWKVTGDRAHLEEAHSLVSAMRNQAPEEYRQQMLEIVPLNREVTKAWAEVAG